VSRISLSVEETDPADAAEIAVLLQRSILELCVADHGNDPKKLDPWLANKTPNSVCRWIAAPGCLLSACLKDNTGRRIAGVAMGNEAGEVLLNYVHPEMRYSGVSKALMAAVEGYFVGRGLVHARLTSTRTAERFYRSIGYVETGKIDLHRGMPVLPFQKDLQS